MGIDELFATVAVDEATGDTEAYRAKLEVVGIIARLLGINTEISIATLHLLEDSAEE